MKQLRARLGRCRRARPGSRPSFDVFTTRFFLLFFVLRHVHFVDLRCALRRLGRTRHALRAPPSLPGGFVHAFEHGNGDQEGQHEHERGGTLRARRDGRAFHGHADTIGKRKGDVSLWRRRLHCLGKEDSKGNGFPVRSRISEGKHGTGGLRVRKGPPKRSPKGTDFPVRKRKLKGETMHEEAFRSNGGSDSDPKGIRVPEQECVSIEKIDFETGVDPWTRRQTRMDTSPSQHASQERVPRQTVGLGRIGSTSSRAETALEARPTWIRAKEVRMEQLRGIRRTRKGAPPGRFRRRMEPSLRIPVSQPAQSDQLRALDRRSAATGGTLGKGTNWTISARNRCGMWCQLCLCTAGCKHPWMVLCGRGRARRCIESGPRTRGAKPATAAPHPSERCTRVRPLRGRGIHNPISTAPWRKSSLYDVQPAVLCHRRRGGIESKDRFRRNHAGNGLSWGGGEIRQNHGDGELGFQNEGPLVHDHGREEKDPQIRTQAPACVERARPTDYRIRTRKDASLGNRLVLSRGRPFGDETSQKRCKRRQ